MRRSLLAAWLVVVCGCGGGAEGIGGDVDGGIGRQCTGAPYPLILSHGFSGFQSIGPLNYYFQVADDLRARGETVVEATVTPYASSEQRGAELAKIVDETLATTGACKVNIIAHSQGGLDVRYMIGTLHYGDRIASVITVSTPHRGTKIADAALGLVPGVADGVIDALAALLGQAINPSSMNADLRASMTSLSEANAAKFAEANPDDKRVAFYSVAGRSFGQHADKECAGGLWPNPPQIDLVDPLLFPTASFLAIVTGPNDGLVPVESARWGTFLGCVPADHLDEIGQIADLIPDPSSGWDHVKFYEKLVDFLHQQGF